MGGVALQRPAQPKHRLPLPLHTAQHHRVGNIELEAHHRHRPVVFEVPRLRFAPTPRPCHVTAERGRGVGGRGCYGDHETSTHRHGLWIIDDT
jgi:hypothetical protein